MAIIGRSNILNVWTPTSGTVYLHNLSADHHTAVANEEVFRVAVYNNTSTTETAEIGLYDVTGGVSGATLVAGTNHTFTGTDGSGWLTFDLASPVSLTEGNDYAVGYWSNGWKGYVATTWTSACLSYNSGETGLITPFTQDGTWSAGVISMYAETQISASTTPEITSVNGGSTIDDGDSVAILGSSFGSSGTVTFCLEDNIAAASATVQSQTAYTDTSITVTVTLPSGASDGDVIYCFVTNDSAESNASGFESTVTTIPPTLCTLQIEDGSTNAVICTSTDFATGMSARIVRDSVSYAAEQITAVSTEDTANPVLYIYFPISTPVGTDTIYISYNAAVGDIAAVTGGIALASFTDKAGTVCT